MKRIVVIGGTGHFGFRFCRRFAGEPGTELVVASRSLVDAQSHVDELHRLHRAVPVRAASLDHDSESFERDLAKLAPDIVVHTAGPYQAQDYRVAKACILVGSHYVDLADGRDFVKAFTGLDGRARQRGVLLVSGASTLPGLSSVVIDSVRGEFSSIDRIEITIAPAHQTPRGAGTVSAVLSYCGRRFAVLERGEWKIRHGWQDLRVHRYPELGTRLAAACDVPDLGLLPGYVPGVSTVTFHAALEAKWEQLTLWLMAWLVRLRVKTSWTGLVPTVQKISDRLIGLGSDVGGMDIRVSGTDVSRRPKSLTWNLTARRNHGPEIPCIPALILTRKLAREEIEDRGAAACLGMFSLADFADEVRDLDIVWSVQGGDSRVAA